MSTSVTRTCGVYAIVNQANGKQYIGSSNHIERRWRAHRNALRKDNHDNPKLQKSWNAYGEVAFEWRIVEECAPEDRIDREQFWLDMLHPALNVIPTASIAAVWAHPDSAATVLIRAKMSAAKIGKSPWNKDKPFDATARAKMSASAKQRMRVLGHPHKGKTFDAEWRAHLSEAHKGHSPANKGRPLSDETKRKMSVAIRKNHQDPIVREKMRAPHLGRKQSTEERARRSESMKRQYAEGRRTVPQNFGGWNKGKTWPQETREKLRAIGLERAARGEIKPPVVTPEGRARIAAANRGKSYHTTKHTEATKALIAEKKRGAKHSPETRAKMSASHKRVWAEGRHKSKTTDQP